MDPEIQAALDHWPKNWWKTWDRRFGLARDRLSEVLGVRVLHPKGGNYESSERLVVFFNQRGRVIERGWADDYNNAAYIAEFMLSYKGPLFTHDCCKRRGRNEWRLLPDSDLRTEIRATVARVVKELTKLGWRRVPRKILHRPAPGHVTELEGKPATVYEVLFSEI